MVSVDVEAEEERKIVMVWLRGRWRGSGCRGFVGAIVVVGVSSWSVAVL